MANKYGERTDSKRRAATNARKAAPAGASNKKQKTVRTRSSEENLTLEEQVSLQEANAKLLAEIEKLKEEATVRDREEQERHNASDGR